MHVSVLGYPIDDEFVPIKYLVLNIVKKVFLSYLKEIKYISQFPQFFNN